MCGTVAKWRQFSSKRPSPFHMDSIEKLLFSLPHASPVRKKKESQLYRKTSPAIAFTPLRYCVIRLRYYPHHEFRYLTHDPVQRQPRLGSGHRSQGIQRPTPPGCHHGGCHALGSLTAMKSAIARKPDPSPVRRKNAHRKQAWQNLRADTSTEGDSHGHARG